MAKPLVFVLSMTSQPRKKLAGAAKTSFEKKCVTYAER